jgi:hypothetical protein
MVHYWRVREREERRERGRERKGDRALSYHSSVGCHPLSQAQFCECRSDKVGHLLFSSLCRNVPTFFPHWDDGMVHSCSAMGPFGGGGGYIHVHSQKCAQNKLTVVDKRYLMPSWGNDLLKFGQNTGTYPCEVFPPHRKGGHTAAEQLQQRQLGLRIYFFVNLISN